MAVGKRLLLVMLGIGVSAAVTGEARADDETVAAFAVFKEQCGKCHGGPNPKGKLSLLTPRGIARGGEGGPVVVPGDPDQSLLWQRIVEQEMPPDIPLSSEARAVVRRWIESGAKGIPTVDPSSKDLVEHWAFQLFDDSPLLAARSVSAAERLRSRVDGWIQQSLDSHSLTLGPDASPRQLARRVAFDLHGIPFDPDDVVDAMPLDLPDAYERLIDRALASPRYGEAWGKHWLDASGYADSNGYFSADTDRPLAYRYRDYVIRSLNADKPFDQFVREQLAGDELSGFDPAGPATEQVIELLEATHFLRNGQDGTDDSVNEPEAHEIDRRAALEAVVQVTCSSLLGLTVQCARCHDHKFEPISQTEYYQLQAIFFPAFNPNDWVKPKDRLEYAHLPGERPAWEQRQRELDEAMARVKLEFRRAHDREREPSVLLFEDQFDAAESLAERWSATAPGDDRPSGEIRFPSGMLDAPHVPHASHAAVVENGQLRLITTSGEAWLSTTRGFDWTPEAKDDWIQVTFELVDNKVSGAAAERIGYTIAAHDFDGSSSVGGGNFLIDGNPTTVTQVYADYPRKGSRVRGEIGQQGYVPGGSYGVRITNAGDGKFLMEHLVDRIPDGKSLELKEADLPEGGFAFFFCAGRSYVVDKVRVERSDSTVLPADDLSALRKRERLRRAEYKQALEKLDKQRAPRPGRKIAWVTDRSAKPPEVPFLRRGLYHEKGDLVGPAGLRILEDAAYPFRVDNGAKSDPALGELSRRTTGYRTAFAEWITRPNSPPAALVSRVWMNRQWRQFFGTGIVATTDNLGQSGALATHPELLNDLARRFASASWSTKLVQRGMLLSTVYRQSSLPRESGLAADPENRLLWRWSLRRLSAECVRDGMLAASGELDALSFGPYVPTRQTPVGEVIVDEKVDGSRRRSVYLQQRRSQTLSLLRLFDAPAMATVCSSRVTSSVPLQSLTQLNSEFSLARAAALAARVRAVTGSPLPESTTHREREIDSLFWFAIGRGPTGEELRTATGFLAEQAAEYPAEVAAERALADFAQMLLASNAFLYLE